MGAFNWPINPAVVNAGPVQFVEDGVPRQVTTDSVTPTNTRPLPVQQFNSLGTAVDGATEQTLSTIDSKIPLQGQSLMANSMPVVLASDQTPLPSQVQFVKDGVTVSVVEDTLSPANNAPLPVKLTSATGDINITAGDLNVHLSHSGVNFDSTRIGDGTNLLGITAANEAQVAVTAALPTGSNTIGAVTQSGSWNIADITGTVSLPTGAATEATLSAIDTKLPTQGAALTAASLPVNIASDQTVPISASSLPLPAGAATESTLSGLNAKLANDFGGSSGAVRTSAQIGNSTGQADFGSGTVSAQTLRVIIASDQSAIPVNTGSGNTAGTHVTATVSGTAATQAPPSNAVGFFLQASDQNAANLRWAIGSTATASVGSQLQPGRGTVFIPVAASISIISESGTNEYQLQWIRSV